MSAATTSRRKLRFETLADVVNDARDVVSRPHRALGNWSAGQILEHLAVSIDLSFDGYGFRAPWPIRLAALPLKNRFLVRPTPAGFRLPKRAAILIPPPEVADEEGLGHLERSIARFETEVPSQPHPVFGRLLPEEYRLLHLRHSELHLSFLVPN